MATLAPVPAASRDPHYRTTELQESRPHDRRIQQLARLIGQLAVDANDNGLLVFAGAGISVAAPSACPTWAGLRKEILRSLIDKLIQYNWPNKRYLMQTRRALIEMDLRPETFMWALEQDIGLGRTLGIVGGINDSVPNQNHNGLAHLCHVGVVTAVVTTNFDTYIERALIADGTRYTAIRDEDETALGRDSQDAGLLVYKPHGCMSKPLSMRYRIDQIQSLPQGGRELLSRLLRGFAVLVVGYSGNDEDIFPVMREALAKSPMGSYICVFPGGPADEPIQQWDISGMRSVQRFYADPSIVLRCVTALLDRTKHAAPHPAAKPHSPKTPRWTDKLASEVAGIGPDTVAVTIAHLCHLHGQHRRALSFANLAQDIFEDTHLSSGSRETLLFIREMQARVYTELGEGQLAQSLRTANVREVLKRRNYHE